MENGKKENWNYLLAPVYTICLLNYDIDVFTPTKFRTDVALMDISGARAPPSPSYFVGGEGAPSPSYLRKKIAALLSPSGAAITMFN